MTALVIKQQYERSLELLRRRHGGVRARVQLVSVRSVDVGRRGRPSRCIDCTRKYVSLALHRLRRASLTTSLTCVFAVLRKGHLPFLLSTCEYVLFGGTHDDGYEEILSNLAATRHRDKVILLRTTPDSAEDIPQAGLEEVRFPLLFEEQDPDERVRRSSVSTGDHSNAAATRSYSNIAASSSTGGGTATATHVPDEYDFKPLLRALLGRLGQPTPVRRPLRGSIAYELKCLSNPPIDFAVPKEFKKYSAEAESRGLIQLGVGDREGSEWIELAISIKEAKAYVEVK